jgi:hypothetical protein
MPPVQAFFDRDMDACLRCDPGGFSDFFDYPRLIVDMEYHNFPVCAEDGWRIKFARMGQIRYWNQ